MGFNISDLTGSTAATAASAVGSTANSVGFDASSYIDTGSSVYSSASSAYTTVSSAADAISSDSTDKLAIEATELAAITFLPGVGFLIAAWLQKQPIAGAGPGVCTTDPPPGPSPSQLQGWQYYKSWESTFGQSYGPDAADSFEAFANPILRYNRMLEDNCYANNFVLPHVLLAQLVTLWNNSHRGPTRTITRTGLNPSGWGLIPGYDPIASGLEDALYYDSSGNFIGSGDAPKDATSTLVINDGAEFTVTPLTFSPAAVAQINASNGAATAIAATTTSTALKGVAVAGAIGAVGVIAYAQTTGVSVWALLTGGWASIAGVLETRENPIGSSSATQTILFSRSQFSVESAKKWARAHGYKSSKVDVTAKNIRLRQHPPSEFRRMRTVDFGHGIRAVIGFY